MEGRCKQKKGYGAGGGGQTVKSEMVGRRKELESGNKVKSEMVGWQAIKRTWKRGTFRNKGTVNGTGNRKRTHEGGREGGIFITISDERPLQLSAYNSTKAEH
jgi:hypothetical protein